MTRRAALLAVIVVLATACSGDDDGSAAPEESATTTTTAELRLAPGQVRHAIGVAFQYGSFEVTVGDVVYDSNEQELLLGLRFRNLTDGWAMPETAATLDHDGVEHPVLGTLVDVPPRMSADLTWTVSALPGDPVPDGVLRWGRPDRDQPTVGLDGSGENVWRPVAVDVDGWVGIGRYTVHVTEGRVLAASTELDAQADPDTRVLRLFFDTFVHRIDAVNGFHPPEHLRLRRPDGTVVEAIASSPTFLPVSWTAMSGGFVDFPVAASVAGDYVLELSSLSTHGFSTLHPELIDRAPLAFTLAQPAVPTSEVEGPLPAPELRPDAEASSATVDVVPLSGGAINVGGYLFRPIELRLDAMAGTAELDGEVRSIEVETPAGLESLVGGLLDSPPEFSFTAALVSGGRYYAGVVAAFVDETEPSPVTIEFLSVSPVDRDDLGLVIGPRNGAASSLPLTEGSSLVRYPPAPTIGAVDAEPVTAGDWTVQLDGYRVGFLRGDTAPRPGSLHLEVFFSVTASPNAIVKALGLSFRPSVQLFLAQPDGYMQQPVGESGLVFYQPGETKRQSVTFEVPDIFSSGAVAFVLRGVDEGTDVTAPNFVETTFGARLASASSSDPGEL